MRIALLHRARSPWLRPMQRPLVAYTNTAMPSSVRPSTPAAQRFSTHRKRPHFRRVPDPKNPIDDTKTKPAAPVLALPHLGYTLYENEVHCFLGVNGSGKSRLLQQLQSAAATAPTDPNTGRRVRVGALSFDAHRAFVGNHGHKVVADVLGGISSPEARDLIVRLGLYPVWDSHVRHLSTGEIRKVLLAVALLQVPRASVLILDQPFDGLDKKARRQLEWMLGQLTKGFTKLLVDTGGRNEAFAYKTQVLLVANRLEQVFPDILTHVVLIAKRDLDGGDPHVDIREWLDRDGTNSVEMLTQLRGFFNDQKATDTDISGTSGDYTSPSFPEPKLAELVTRLYASSAQSDPMHHRPAIRLRQLSVAYGRRLLLEDVDFERDRHEHWALLGPNGSGKSSLMRVLMQTNGHGQVSGDVVVNSDGIAVVSTDQHLEMLENEAFADRTAQEWLMISAQNDEEIVETTVQLLGIQHEILSRRFAELSQGEQKLVQIACAIAQRPEILILDEITHGLDMFNRARVLKVINALGRHAHAHTHLILITHHEDEIVACFADVFEICDQKLRRVDRK